MKFITDIFVSGLIYSIAALFAVQDLVGSVQED
jgi:hypothetical protein